MVCFSSEKTFVVPGPLFEQSEGTDVESDGYFPTSFFLLLKDPAISTSTGVRHRVLRQLCVSCVMLLIVSVQMTLNDEAAKFAELRRQSGAFRNVNHAVTLQSILHRMCTYMLQQYLYPCR